MNVTVKVQKYMPITVSTPGRICLFGEHQDYLGLPVIPSAISVRVTLAGSFREDKEVHFDLPDIHSSDQFSFAGELKYEKPRDYLRSVVNVMRRHGYTFSNGLNVHVHGTIPINSGTSSSSALIVAWIDLLARMSDQSVPLPPETIAVYAHEAEVLEFGEPGGMMDHFSTAVGGVLFLEFSPTVRMQRLGARLGTFVLGDSMEPKETTTILSRVKDPIIRATERIAAHHPGFSLQTTSHEQIRSYSGKLSEAELSLILGTITNRDITQKARTLLTAPAVDHAAVGKMLADHHAILRDVLKISTPKIERMLDAAGKAGAYGGKINGSGGGGCMFVYAPERPEEVAEAIEREGGRAYIVCSEPGTRLESEGMKG